MDRNERQRERRKINRNWDYKKYEKTKNGFLMRTYRNMLSRVLGIQKLKAHLYQGLGIIKKEDFYKWSLNDFNFNELFSKWVDSGYNRKISPSIDRIITELGYEEGNIQWITHSENSRKGATSIKRKLIKN
jgi:hypothetical protein